MTQDTLSTPTSRRTTSIIALNAVSTLTHVSQYGLGTMLIPIALEAKNASPEIIGFTSAILWFGMLIGLLVAGKIIHAISYRNTVLLSMAISATSFIAIPFIDWHFWFLPAAILGCGIGLRWIANETWLYRLSPSSAQGRIVGIHEALIGLATIIGPLIIVALGASNARIFGVAAAIILAALVPLFMAHTLSATDENVAQSKTGAVKPASKSTFNKNIIYWLSFGGLIAGLGGWIENSLLAFLPVYATDIGLHSDKTAWLFTLLGIGAFVCQFPIGWLADIKSVNWAATLCSAITLFAVLFAILFDQTFLSLAVIMLILGATLSGLLTLGIIWATQHSTGSALAGQMRQLSVTYTTLSAISPFVGGFIVGRVGSSSLFWQQLAVILVLAVVLFKHKE
jgi:MFS family permease